MKRDIFILLALAFAGSAHAQALRVVPNANAATEGAFGLSTPITGVGRTLQMIIGASQLTPIINGSITGLTFRLDGPEVASKPINPINFASYNIFVGQSAVAPAAASATFANNYVPGTKTQLRSGALSLAPGYFPNSVGNPNAFGAIVSFNLGSYAYTGGDLVLELSHTGSGTSFALDAVENNSDFVAHGAAGFNALTSTNINSVTDNLNVVHVLAPVVQLQFTPAAPEPGTFVLLGLGALALGIKRRRTAA